MKTKTIFIEAKRTKMWQNYFDKIYIINLTKRVDRLITSLRILNDYEIEVERYEAIEHEKGEIGLVQTMKKLFTECIEKGYKKVLVFEDDIEFLESKELTHEVMTKCVGDLERTQWDILYLGTNHPAHFIKRYTETLLPIHQGYSTHAAAYNLSAMQFIVNSEISEPVDNYIVRTIQKNNKCYCSYPMLATQRVDYSDIGAGITDWSHCLEKRFKERTRYLK